MNLQGIPHSAGAATAAGSHVLFYRKFMSSCTALYQSCAAIRHKETLNAAGLHDKAATLSAFA
jgi:hypothetical protein